MLRLRKGKAPFVPVDLGGGAVMRIRPASQTDAEEASARAQTNMLGLVAGSEAGAILTDILGDDFDLGALNDKARVIAAGARLTEIYMVMLCQDGWTGVATEDGTLIEQPDAAAIALLLEDTAARSKVLRVVNSTIHQQDAEKNVSAASQNGGAGIQTGVPTVGETGTPAPSADTSTENSEVGADALSSKTRH